MAVDDRNGSLQIGELARRAGVTSRSVRHYHSIGLLPEPRRDQAGYRRYGSADLALLEEIGRLRTLGMPIELIARTLGDQQVTELRLDDALPAYAMHALRTGGDGAPMRRLELFRRFAAVTGDQVEELAQDLARDITPALPADRPTLATGDAAPGPGEWLTEPQRDCVLQVRALLVERTATHRPASDRQSG